MASARVDAAYAVPMLDAIYAAGTFRGTIPHREYHQIALPQMQHCCATAAHSSARSKLPALATP
jgi:hypothetical protein